MKTVDEKDLRRAVLDLWRAETAYVQTYGAWTTNPNNPTQNARLLEAERRMDMARLMATKLEAEHRDTTQ